MSASKRSLDTLLPASRDERLAAIELLRNRRCAISLLAGEMRTPHRVPTGALIGALLDTYDELRAELNQLRAAAARVIEAHERERQ